ncbi:hypothetical protein [Lacinutrix sp. Hel_I_90]|uniref:hypothetical protein n=1 Tax=Lacinutrix sp. Hel_I_90 TaxID=1249999 RepID=UPI0005CAB973|nr:hypothetical protein [Lacinutrix sp. Hel_I_90]
MEIPKGETHPVKYENNKELLKDFSKKGATLYFQNEKINLETALSYVDKYKNLHISTSHYSTPNPIVNLYENKAVAYPKN